MNFLSKLVDGGVIFAQADENAVQDKLNINSAQADVDTIINTNGAESFFLEGSTGNLGIGTVAGAAPAGRLEIAKAGTFLAQYLTDYSDTLTDYSYLILRKSHHDTLGTVERTLDTEYLGAIFFQGAKNSNPDVFQSGAKILCIAVGDAGASYVGAKLLFQTGKNDASFNTRLSIEDTGQVVVGIPDTADALPLLRVWGGTAGAVDSVAGTLVTFEDNGDVFLSLLTPAANASGFNFGDVDDADKAILKYDHALDLFSFNQNILAESTAARTITVQGHGNTDCGDFIIKAYYNYLTNQEIGSIRWNAIRDSDDQYQDFASIYGAVQNQTGNGNGMLSLRTALNGVLGARMTLYSDYVKFWDYLILDDVKSGATQVAAGAAAGEVWKTASHATLPNNVLMIGV